MDWNTELDFVGARRSEDVEDRLGWNCRDTADHCSNPAGCGTEEQSELCGRRKKEWRIFRSRWASKSKENSWKTFFRPSLLLTTCVLCLFIPSGESIL